MFWDPMYFLFALPALLLAFYAQAKVRNAYQRAQRIPNERGMNGLEVAHYLLSAAGLDHVRVEVIPGALNDHYDPRHKVLRLSQATAQSRSVAALGIVAHEVGHAAQDAKGYLPLQIRTSLVPAVNLGSWLGPILFFIGWFLSAYGAVTLGRGFAWAGVTGFALAALFALVTLPVEFNASRRALEMARVALLADGRQIQEAKRVLDAAALTYVAALAQALSTLLYYIFLLSGGRRRR